MTDQASILIVDDEPNILLSLQFLMKKAGYDVRTARDGEQALAEIARAKPDLVLLDVMMPKLDGFTVCQRIRATPEWQDVRIIMLTARGRDVEREKGLALGADDYITKPFSTNDAIEPRRSAARQVRAAVRPLTAARRGNHMLRHDRTREYLIALFLFGVLLLVPPFLLVFNRPVQVLGLPLLYLYLFAAWTGLIVLGAVIARRIDRDGAASADGGSSARDATPSVGEGARDA